jgi:hypothetical protein
MLVKCIHWITLSLIFLFLTCNAHAFDGHRKGFVLGIGLGSGLITFSPGEDPKYRLAAITDFRIGYAIDNSWQLYWTFKDAQLRLHKSTNWLMFEGIGCSYYFKPEAVSPFVAGGIGFSNYGGSNRYSHFGSFAGGGLEFSRHLSLETYLSWAVTHCGKFLSLRISVNVLGY